MPRSIALLMVRIEASSSAPPHIQPPIAQVPSATRVGASFVPGTLIVSSDISVLPFVRWTPRGANNTSNHPILGESNLIYSPREPGRRLRLSRAGRYDFREAPIERSSKCRHCGRSEANEEKHRQSKRIEVAGLRCP